MLVLGLLLLVAAAVVTVVAIVNGGGAAELDVFGGTLETSVRGIFVAGAVVVLVGVAGLLFFLAGAKRERARRQEVKALRREVKAKPEVEPAEGKHVGDADEHFESTPREEQER